MEEILRLAATFSETQAWRIGVTGPPGAGKSTLIARLARARLARLSDIEGEATERLAVLAVDPSSPRRHGALLGDRIRMDAISDDPRVYVRSLASRGGRDGLAHNIVDLLALADAYGFAEVVLETVGVGQAEHAARALVDTLILVLHPEAGDAVQAMKSGIIEVADVYVVNKADLPGASRTVAELQAVLKATRPAQDDWMPPVIEIRRDEAGGVTALDAALERHRAFTLASRDKANVDRERRRYHLQSLIAREIDEILDGDERILRQTSPEARFRAAMSALRTVEARRVTGDSDAP